MRSLFRAFKARGVQYLLISGQASVLYGGAFFSQDLDLWIRPTASNVNALLGALRCLRARVHKLTPPLTLRNLRRGHGFHFLVPLRGGPDLYLDLMGQPPRVGPFGPALGRAERMATPWGVIPVVCIEDLVEIKKTNRPSDYEVITRLAMIRLGREAAPGPRLLAWALRNAFRVEDLWAMIERYGRRAVPAGMPAAARALWRIRSAGREPSERDLRPSSRRLAREALRLQERGRAYWIPRLRELRRMRAEGLLLPEGAMVGAGAGQGA
ncbi:MAG: hypothetical protein HY748_18315 [Elusimicrobia bacterium]|nr:hypothetical protein [Elusimicrobiota bacterium]